MISHEVGVHNQMRVAIVGANGFLGSHLLSGLSKKGYKAIGFVRSSASLERLESLRVNVGEQVRFCRYGEDFLDMLQQFGPTVIINSVGYGLNPNQRKLADGFDVNIRFGLDLCDFASDLGADLIHIGSAYEYRIHEAPISEYAPINPLSFYGITKASASLLLQLKATEIDSRVLIVRPFGIYGPLETAGKLFPAIIAACRDRRPIRLSDGGKIRDYTYIDDFVEAFDRILCSATDWPPVLNVGSGRPLSIKYIAERICHLLDADRKLLQWGELPARKGDPDVLVAEPTLAYRLFGWTANTNLDEGLRRTIGHQTRS